MASSSRLSRVALGFAVGAFAFWLPIVALYWLFGGDWASLITGLLLTFLLPFFCCFALDSVAVAWNLPRLGLSVAMIFGIWATGPFFMTLANTSTAGEGFHMADAWGFVGFATATFPISTFMLSTYNLSLFAVQFTTFLLPIFSMAGWTFQPLARRCFLYRSIQRTFRIGACRSRSSTSFISGALTT
jgi:hypothetical protein